MNVPGKQRPPRDWTEWKVMPTPMPDGVDLDSKVKLIQALKSEGFLDPAAACHLPNIPERLQLRMFASLLYVAREFPEPFLLDPLVDYQELPLPPGDAAVGSFWAAQNLMQINPNHALFTGPEVAEWSELGWERVTNFMGGHVIHEATHKLQGQHGVEDSKMIDDAIAKAMDDWRAPYPNAFQAVGKWFTANYGNYGRHLLVERDAVAMQFHAHGFHNPFSQAIVDSYKELHGPHRLIDGRPTATVKERLVLKAADTNIRVGENSIGKVSRERGESFECSDGHVYHFRSGANRYTLANGHLIDVDDSIRQGRLVGEDFGTNAGFVIETGMPLSRKDSGDVPEQYVTGLVSEAVSVSRVHMLGVTDEDRSSTILATDLVASIYRDLHSVKAGQFLPVRSSQTWPTQTQKDHAVFWQLRRGETAGVAIPFLPHLNKFQVRSSKGLEVSIGAPDGAVFTRGTDTEGNKVDDGFYVDVDVTLANLRAGGPLVLIDKLNGEAYDYGEAARVLAIEESPVPAADLEALVQLPAQRPSSRSAQPLSL